MNTFTTEQKQYNRTAMRKSMELLTQRLNQMDPATRKRAERTILNLRARVEEITRELNMAGAA